MNEIIEVNGARYRKAIPACPGSCDRCAGKGSVTLCEMLPPCKVVNEDGSETLIIYVEII